MIIICMITFTFDLYFYMQDLSVLLWNCYHYFLFGYNCEIFHLFFFQ